MLQKAKNGLPALAAVVAISLSAFTSINEAQTQRVSDLVWFEVNPDGTAVNPTHGIQSETAPSQCQGGQVLCASALSIAEGQVVENQDGTYSIEDGVDIADDSQMSVSKP